VTCLEVCLILVTCLGAQVMLTNQWFVFTFNMVTCLKACFILVTCLGARLILVTCVSIYVDLRYLDLTSTPILSCLP
jgi:hypothetical protein